MPTDSDIHISQSALVIISTIVAGLIAAISLLFRTLMTAKDAQNASAIVAMEARIDQAVKDKELLYADLKRERDAFRAMTVTAIVNLEIAANISRKAQGLPPFERGQEEKKENEKDIQSLRFRLSAASTSLGLPVRTLEEDMPISVINDLKKSIDVVAGKLLPVITQPILPPAYVVCDSVGTIISVGGHILPLLHWTERDLVGNNVKLLIPEKLQSRHDDGMKKGRNLYEPYEGTTLSNIPALTKQGDEVFIDIRIIRWVEEPNIGGTGGIRFGAYFREHIES